MVAYQEQHLEAIIEINAINVKVELDPQKIKKKTKPSKNIQ